MKLIHEIKLSSLMGMRRYLAACAIAAFGLSILFVGLQVISSATSPPRPTVSATASLKSTSAEGSSGGKGRVDAATRAARRARRAEALFLSKSRGKEESQAARRRAAEVNSFRHSNNGTMLTQQRQQQQHDGASHGTKDDGDGSDVDGRRKRQLLLPPVCTAGDDRVKWLNDPILHSRVRRRIDDFLAVGSIANNSLLPPPTKMMISINQIVRFHLDPTTIPPNLSTRCMMGSKSLPNFASCSLGWCTGKLPEGSDL
jgi:hypothetical protein